MADLLTGKCSLLETHPESAWEFMGLPNGKQRWLVTRNDRGILGEFGVTSESISAATSPAHLDALLAALVARLHFEGSSVSFGDKGEGLIILPRPGSVDLVALDVDGTLTEVPSPWRHVHERLRLWDTEGDAIRQSWLAGKISYDRFCVLDVGLWNRAGVSVDQVTEILDAIPIRQQAGKMLNSLVKTGIKIVMISSGFRRVAERIVKDAGMDGKIEIVANQLLNGPGGKIGVRVNVSGDATSNRSKGEIVRRTLLNHGVSPVRALAVGDGPSDKQMFERCALTELVSTPDDLLRVSHKVISGYRP